MASSINASSSGSGGIVQTADASGILQLQSNGTTAAYVDTSANLNVSNSLNTPNTFGFKNRIINGAMVIDQRNAGAAVTTSASYITDRFTQAFANASCSFQQVSDAPSGFINSLKLTVTTGSAPSAGTNNVIIQKIEGLNVFDFSFGSASAANVTLSFWVKGSVTGTYAVSFTNSAFNRSFVATYTINAASTWEQKTVTIAGDTTGTWLTTNGIGLTVLWDFGSGTNLNTTAGSWQAGNYYRTSGCTTIASTTNATFQITGVQLEKAQQRQVLTIARMGLSWLCVRGIFKSSVRFNLLGLRQFVLEELPDMFL
jgi:hypothetical protein